VLVTGGARGITASVTLELAKRYKPIPILVGRSPQPREGEPPDLTGRTTARELKSALFDRKRKEGRTDVHRRIGTSL